MDNREKLIQVLQALETIPVKGFDNVSTMAGCMAVLREVTNSLPNTKAAKK